MWDPRTILKLGIIIVSHMWDLRTVLNLGIVECPSFKNCYTVPHVGHLTVPKVPHQFFVHFYPELCFFCLAPLPPLTPETLKLRN